jgi:hypothetical protein
LSSEDASMVSTELKVAQGLRYENCSKLRCFETDFATSPKTDLWGTDGMDDGVCASKTAKPLDGQCRVASKSWHGARVYCGSSGARLCSAEELARGHGWNTGCGSTGMFLWTNTPCRVGTTSSSSSSIGVDGNDAAVSSSGMKGYVQLNQQRLLGGLGQHRKCVPITGKVESSPVCCADVSCEEDADMKNKEDADIQNGEENGEGSTDNNGGGGGGNGKAKGKKGSKAQPLVSNDRVAVVLFGESARPG